MRRAAFFAIIGLGGAAILIWLGTWQVQRLAWKEGVIADIDARIEGVPAALPAKLDAAEDRYRPVQVTGRFVAANGVRMLASRRTTGAVFRIVLPFETQGARRILVDVGWVTTGTNWPTLPVAADQLPQGEVTLTGNLDWPNEADSFTPAPERESGLWYARDIDTMADFLGTQDILLVLREKPQPDFAPTPWPIDTSDIPNNHLQYAITWFSLAVIWLAMSLYFVRRKTSASKG